MYARLPALLLLCILSLTLAHEFENMTECEKCVYSRDQFNLHPEDFRADVLRMYIGNLEYHVKDCLEDEKCTNKKYLSMRAKSRLYRDAVRKGHRLNATWECHLDGLC